MSTLTRPIRETIEEREIQTLSKYAAKSKFTEGRAEYKEPCPIRTEFQRDRDKILHSKAFRRLKHKTQVFFSPSDDHYRTRMTHTLEVSQIARTIARALFINEDLAEAIALGHDLGHTPFGHSGEDALDKIMTEGFRHNEQSIRVVTHIEDLNLTKETLNGILNHSHAGCDKPKTLEGQVVKISDKIAYIHHDIQDALRAEIITNDDLPKDCAEYFTNDHSGRVAKMILDIVENRYDKPEISMSEECKFYYTKLRSWMFENVYTNPIAKSEEEKAKRLVKQLFEHYSELIEQNVGNITPITKGLVERTAADYIAGMTDRYALVRYKELTMPAPFIKKNKDDFLFKLAIMNGLEN